MKNNLNLKTRNRIMYKEEDNRQKRIRNAIFLFLLLVFLFIVLGTSQGKKESSILIEFVDLTGNVATSNEEITLYNPNSDNKYIILPKVVNGKKTTAFSFELEEVIYEIEEENKIYEETDLEEINLELENIDSKNEEIEQVGQIEETPEIKEIKVEEIYLSAGEVVNLKNKDIKNLKMHVEFEKKTENETVLYNSAGQYKDGNSTAILSGFMTLENNIKIKKYVEKEEEKDDENSLIEDINKIKNDERIDGIYEVSELGKTDKYIFEYDNTEDMRKYNVYVAFEKSVLEEKEKNEDLDIKKEIDENEDFENVYWSEKYVIVDLKQINEVAPNLKANIDLGDFKYIVLTSESEENNIMGMRAIGLMSESENLGIPWDGSSSSSLEGSGSEADPYKISNGSDLAYLRDRVNARNMYEGSYFSLISNINMDDRPWTGIGLSSYPFRGHLNGNGFTISNVLIQPTDSLSANTILSYGLFSFIGNGSSRQYIQNFNLNNVKIQNSLPNITRSNSNTGYNFGILSGSVFRNVSISDVSVRNSEIVDLNAVEKSSNNIQYIAGGLVGQISNYYRNIGSINVNQRVEIDRISVNANISLQINAISGRRTVVYARSMIGGIVGLISNQNRVPENSVYTGSLSGETMMGPIAAALYYNTSYTSNNPNNTALNAVWQLTDASGLNHSSRYYGYTSNGRTYTSTITSGTSNSRNGSNNSNVEYYQGMNKGTYTTNRTTILNMLNDTDAYWEDDGTYFSVVSTLSLNVYESPWDTYNVEIMDLIPFNRNGTRKTYTVEWILDGTRIAYRNATLNGGASLISATDQQYIAPDFYNDRQLEIRVQDSTGRKLQYNIEIKKVNVEITFSYDDSQKKLTGILSGKALNYVSVDDFDVEWQAEDITGADFKILDDTTLEIYNVSREYDYRLTVISRTYPIFTDSQVYMFGDRIVIFVNQSSGNDNNDGFTPQRPVRYLNTAYSRLDASYDRTQNIIVLMGNYTYTDVYTSSSNSTQSKNVTITGMYKGTQYNASWRLSISSGFHYLNGDTTLTQLRLDGNRNSLYLFLQGYSFSILEGVTMYNYATANTNQGLISNSAPAFHVFAGWERYNLANLPRNNPEIIIKSGTYGRIVLNGSPGYSGASYFNNTTSRNFTGTQSNPFNIKATIDIINSTNSSYDYDINLLVGGTAAGNTYANVELNILNGTIGRGLGGSIGDSTGVPNGWYYPINTFLGTVKINISGGRITELYGGSLGRNMGAISSSSNSRITDSYFYGTIEINMSGGIVEQSIFGVGAGGTAGYSTNSSDPYVSYGLNYPTSVTMNLSGGEIRGNVYGGGYGNTEYLPDRTLASDSGTLYGDSEINITGNARIIGNIYGGGRGYNYSSRPNLAQVYGKTDINIIGNPTIQGGIYGSGQGISGLTNMAKLIGDSNITLDGNTTADIYGGGNIARTEGNTHMNILSGNHTGTIYGGGNVGIVDGNSHVYIHSGTINNLYGGGNAAGLNGNSNIYGYSGNITNVYGGGNQASVNTSRIVVGMETAITSLPSFVVRSGDKLPSWPVGSTSININQLISGSNSSGNISNTILYLNGGQVQNSFGGNNTGGTVTTSNIYVVRGNHNYIYGGGNFASVGTSNVRIYGGRVEEIYGGSNRSGVTTANVTLQTNETFDFSNKSNLNYNNTNIKNIYGGSNSSGIVNNSYVNLQSGIVYQVFGGNNQGGITTNTNITSNNVKSQNIYGGGNATNVTNANAIINNGSLIVGSLYGGSNQTGRVEATNININNGFIRNVLGGNNAGGVTVNPSVNILNGEIENVYGGGNNAVIERNTDVNITGGKISNVYGGGNLAAITQNTNVKINSSNINNLIEISGNVYGGGEQGIVHQNTFVEIQNVKIDGSVYAGGNGNQAVVRQNTNLVIGANTTIGTEDSVAPHFGSVFGGGNAAATGLDTVRNSVATVNIKGGNIYGNVYGGANTSVVYGRTQLNIGQNQVTTQNGSTYNHILSGNIYIRGTIFGGGESNAEGSEIYDFSAISVTNSIDIVMDGLGHTSFDTEGSVFGSGNASSSSGVSTIYIKNYGDPNRPGNNISLQRSNKVLIDNSHISLIGTTDRTNEYSNVEFSVSRIDHLMLVNNSTLYMANNANLLKEFSSKTSETGALSSVNIDPETGNTTRNVNNRIYMLEGKNLNIATNESVTTYGIVNGMTFFGLYTNRINPATSTGLYHTSYSNGDEVDNIGTFSYNSYVLGQHKPNHNIYVDGFYTNSNEEGVIKTDYVGVTPEEDLYYMWIVGDALDVTIYEVALTASKYATLGTYELPFTGFSTPNTKYVMAGFSAGLTEGVELINKNEIEPISDSEHDANSLFGLEIKSSRTGWKTQGETSFFTANGGSYTGRREYNSEDTNITPSMLIYMFHSQNISVEKALGDVRIRLQVLEPIDDLNYDIKYIDIIITMDTKLYQEAFYEATITPGEEFELFATTDTNITDESMFSTYFSLVLQDYENSDHYGEYLNYHRTLVSRDNNNNPFVYPRDTKITMIDRTTNQIYYYNVSATDETSGKFEYNLRDFRLMGTSSIPYDEQQKNIDYLDLNNDLAYENFIFHVGFLGTNIENDKIDSTLLLELRNDTNSTLVGVLGILRDRAKYSIYVNRDSEINLIATSDKESIYLGDNVNISIQTNINEQIVDSRRIKDTRYFDNQMGLKLNLIDQDGNQLGIDSLMGISFTYEGDQLPISIDGSVRMKIAENVSNVLSKVKIDTKNNETLSTGEYFLRIESFASPDGMYYGQIPNQMIEKEIYIINSMYGIDTNIGNEMRIFDAETGINENNQNNINMYITTETAVSNPKLTIHLERRIYDSVYNLNYEKVDLKDYTDRLLTPTEVEDYEYVITDNALNATRMFQINMKEELKTGTYKIVVTLYDGTRSIGQSYEHIIIK